MKNDTQVRVGRMAVAAVAVLSLGMAGCNCDEAKKDATAAPVAVEQKAAVEQPVAQPAAEAPAAAKPATEDPAAAVPKDHPAH